ncbi:malonic semialdehyde reductase [Rhodococcus sp. NPDC059968]|uniref:malonic semialdehyde reductase n=1 Tax=Rhodococcus sp. NPDC059968 TaxID=3347017 RepID=UPI003672DB06
MTTSSQDQGSLIALDKDGQELLFRGARTANSFTDEPVTDEQLMEIYELFKWAPSSGNSQPLRIHAVRSPEAKHRLVPHMLGANQEKAIAAPLVLILAADADYHLHLDRLLPYVPNPAARHADRDFRSKNSEFNAALQAGYLILAIRAAGLAAGPMSGFDASGVDAEFFPDGTRHSILIVNVGKPGPEAWFERLPRLDASEVIEFL